MPVIYSPLSDNELDSICLSLVDQDLPYFSAFHEAFVLLYLTGCRVEEIFAVHRWERLQGYEMMFLPQKDNYWRYVTLDSRCDSFIDAVVGRYKPFGGLSSGQLNSLFYNFSQYSNYKVGSKPVSLYLFRYNFIRRLFNDGLNINQIADRMGYTSTTVVGGYLTAEIEKGFFLDTDGFVNINGLWFAQSNFNLTDGGTGIQIRQPFSDGVDYYYYTLPAIKRILLNFPNFRLITSADMSVLYATGYPLGYRYRSYCLPDLKYWSSINEYNINAFGLNFIGTGYINGTAILNRFSLFRFHYFDVPSNEYRFANVSTTSLSYTYQSSNNVWFFPVRVMLVL